MNFISHENLMMMIINDNINDFNRNRRKGKLDVRFYVHDGNKADVMKDGIKIVDCVSIDAACAAVVAVVNYFRKDW